MKVTEEGLLDLIAKEAIIDRAKLTRDAKLGDLGVSSIDLISMMFEIEERWGVVIEDGDIPQVETLGELTDFLLARINADPA